jgi:uncharacterized membrane protein YphA (DoxX/SURF4 family)
MNFTLWIVQIILAINFIFHGFIKLNVPADLPPMLLWINDLSPGMRSFIGIVELLGAAGLLLPALTRIQPRLTPLAALGLAVVMVLAAIWHITRMEYLEIAGNVIFFLLAAFAAYGRWRLKPIEPRSG